MSYSISEAEDDAYARVDAIRAIRAAYPDATLQDLPNGERGWCSPKAETQFVGVSLVVAKTGEPYLCRYAKVGDHGRVYGGMCTRYERAEFVVSKPDVTAAILVALAE